MHDNFWRLVIKWTCTIRSIAFHPKAWNNGNFIGRSSDLFLLWRLPDPFHESVANECHNISLFYERDKTYSYGDSSGFSLDSLLIPSGDNAIPETDVGGKVIRTIYGINNLITFRLCSILRILVESGLCISCLMDE